MYTLNLEFLMWNEQMILVQSEAFNLVPFCSLDILAGLLIAGLTDSAK